MKGVNKIEHNGQIYELALLTNKCAYYVNPNEDEENTVVCDLEGNILSDNFFADNALIEVLVGESDEIIKWQSEYSISLQKNILEDQ